MRKAVTTISDRGFCKKCYKEFPLKMIKKDINGMVQCPYCERLIPITTAANDYMKYGVVSIREVPESSGRLNIEKAIKSQDEQLADLAQKIEKLKKEKEENQRQLEMMRYQEVGITVYEADKDADCVNVSTKFPREMYRLINEVIRFYYNGSMTTYLQSLVASDISIHLPYYQEFLEKQPRTGKTKREDVIVREEFYDSLREKYGAQVADPLIRKKNPGTEAIIETNFNMAVKEGVYTFESNGELIESADPKEIMKKIRDDFEQYDSEYTGDKIYGKYGLQVSLVRADGKAIRRITKTIIGDKEIFVKAPDGKKMPKAAKAYDLYDLFMKYNFSNVILMNPLTYGPGVDIRTIQTGHSTFMNLPVKVEIVDKTATNKRKKAGKTQKTVKK